MTEPQELISLDDYNNRKMEQFLKKAAYFPTGIACPNCGIELVEPSTGIVILTNPPRSNIWCPSCQFTSTKVV